MRRFSFAILLCVSNAISAQFRDTLEQIRPAEVQWGGYTATLAMHPNSARELFAASGNGALYLSENGGANWRFVETFPASNAAYVSYCPRDPNIVLVTTGYDTRTQRSGGIWRSTDGGFTWNEPPTSVPPMNDRCPDRVGASGISWQPNSDTVWVATDCGLQRSLDRGETWERFIVDPSAAGGYDVWDDRFRPDRMFSVLALDANHVVAGGESGYYFMHDGATWNRSERAQPNFYCARGLTASPANPRLLFRADFNSAYLQYSVDQGITWRNFPQPGLGAGNMPPFVRAVPLAGRTTEFELYFGNGVDLLRAVIPYDSARWSDVRFETLAIDHTDVSDIAFHPATRRPLLVAGDFGLMNTVDDGRTWRMAGASRAGHNALNVFGLGVQNIRSRALRSDISFITWHNDTWMSQNSGATWAVRWPVEGVGIRASGPDLRDDSEALISLSPWGGSQALFADGLTRNVTAPTPRADACFRHYAFFRNPTDGRQNVLTVSYTCEGQRAIYDRRATDETSWSEVARLNPSGDFIGWPQAAVRAGTVTLYHAFGASGRNRLARTSNANATGTVDYPTMNGLGSLARMEYNGAEPVWAVKPDDERVLIAADATSNMMMRSTNGGDDWTPLTELTALVTNGGRLRFQTQGKSQAMVIAFNPFLPDSVVVGTAAAGLFHSSDAGLTWRSVFGTTRVRNIGAVAFDRDGTVYLGSEGYGVWRWRVTIDRVPFDDIRILLDRIMIADPLTGVPVPIEIAGDPDRCAACALVLARRGEIVSLRNDPELGLIVGATEPQMLVTIAAKEPKASVFTLPENGFQEPCPSCKNFDEQGLFVRGLLLDGDKVRAVLVGKEKEWQLSDDLLFGKKQEIAQPELRLDGVQHGPGFDIAGAGETITVSGVGFAPDADVEIVLNGYRMATAKSNAKGSFATSIVMKTIPGNGSISAVQKQLKATRELLVLNRDK